MSTSTPLLSVDQLAWSVNQQSILKQLSFNVAVGSFTGLIGPNGAGKSSLLRCLYRFVKPTSGHVFFEQDDIWQLSNNDYAKKTAVVLQETPAHFNLSVFDVVALGLIPHQGLFSQSLFSGNSLEQIQIIEQALVQVGLIAKSGDDFEHLSGGEKQRALIARAIVQAPQLLIMDEPTSHLDVKYQIQIMELAKSLGITVIASFHDLNLASAMCDKLLVLKDGELVADGSPNEVISSQMLSEVFGVCAEVNQHPAHNTPLITYHYGYSIAESAKANCVSDIGDTHE